METWGADNHTGCCCSYLITARSMCMLKLYCTQHTCDANEQQGMEHLRQQLFQLGTVCLQLCNLMAQTTHCLHTIDCSGHQSYLLDDCCCRHSVHKYANKACCSQPNFKLMREHHLISACITVLA